MRPVEDRIRTIEADPDTRTSTFGNARAKHGQKRLDLRPSNIRPNRIVKNALKRSAIPAIHKTSIPQIDTKSARADQLKANTPTPGSVPYSISASMPGTPATRASAKNDASSATRASTSATSNSALHATTRLNICR
jgi:hypothetical protein